MSQPTRTTLPRKCVKARQSAPPGALQKPAPQADDESVNLKMLFPCEILVMVSDDLDIFTATTFGLTCRFLYGNYKAKMTTYTGAADLLVQTSYHYDEDHIYLPFHLPLTTWYTHDNGITYSLSQILWSTSLIPSHLNWNPCTGRYDGPITYEETLEAIASDLADLQYERNERHARRREWDEERQLTIAEVNSSLAKEYRSKVEGRVNWVDEDGRDIDISDNVSDDGQYMPSEDELGSDTDMEEDVVTDDED